MLRFVADFETNNHAEDCRVWGAGIAEIPATQHGSVNVTHFNNMNDFLSFLSNQEKTHEVYFHNLKFDAQFLIHELLSRGFVYDEELNQENSLPARQPILQFRLIFPSIHRLIRSNVHRQKTV